MTSTIRPAMLTLALVTVGALALAQQPTTAQEIIGVGQSTAGEAAVPNPQDTGKEKPPTPGSGQDDQKRTALLLSMPQPNESTWSFASDRFYQPTPGGLGYFLRRDPLWPRLSHPINLVLDHATVRQFADMVAKTSGLPVSVDGTVSKDDRVTIKAQEAPVATILEAVAQQTHLMIARDKEGVLLKPWPSLQVGDRKQMVYSGPLAPWADEWAAQPANLAVNQPANGGINRMVGQQPPNWGTGTKSDAFVSGPGTMPGGLVGEHNYGGYYSGIAVAPLTLTALSERMFVVAEPANGPKGESGTLLTVYKLEGNQIHKVNSIFHKSALGQGRTTVVPQYQGPARVGGSNNGVKQSHEPNGPLPDKDANGAEGNSNIPTEKSPPDPVELRDLKQQKLAPTADPSCPQAPAPSGR
jgi:hypothetical protein